MSQHDSNPAYADLFQRMSQTMDEAIDQVTRGERLTEVTLSRRAGEDSPEGDALYAHLLDRLLHNGLRARWAGDTSHPGITVAFGLG